MLFFLPIGIFNLGIEKQISPKYTLQGDVFISPWKSFAGHELQFYSVSAEGRYYFKEAFKHWYIGAILVLLLITPKNGIIGMTISLKKMMENT
jgi:hypothetical protein